MGDISSPHTITGARPGVMLVRPSLYEHTDQHAATFRRWTVMHFRDLINCSSSAPSAKRISRALRYTNAAGDLLYTIHADDIDVWKTERYHAVSRRLDLENTRTLERGEEKVLGDEHEFEAEPMVWHLVNAEFGIFEEYREEEVGGEGQCQAEAYHGVPFEVLSNQDTESDAPACKLVTLSYASAGVEGTEMPQQLTGLRQRVFHLLYEKYKVKGKVYSSVYRHVPDAQPDMHPVIARGKDGDGEWVTCVLIEGEVGEEAQGQLQSGLESLVEEMKDKERGGEWDVKIGVWSGDLFVV